MTLFKTSFIRKLSLFLVSALLSISVMASDFNQTQRLANQGVVSAQYNLAVLYDNGTGVRQSDSVAKEWFGQACDNGDQGSCDSYRILNQK